MVANILSTLGSGVKSSGVPANKANLTGIGDGNTEIIASRNIHGHIDTDSAIQQADTVLEHYFSDLALTSCLTADSHSLISNQSPAGTIITLMFSLH